MLSVLTDLANAILANIVHERYGARIIPHHYFHVTTNRCTVSPLLTDLRAEPQLH